MTTSAAVLREAARLVAVEERWTRGTLARDAYDKPVEPTDPAAVCFCAMGAIQYAYDKLGVPVEPSCLRTQEHHAMGHAMFRVGDDVGFINYNDAVRHEQILALFEDAIDYADQRGF